MHPPRHRRPQGVILQLLVAVGFVAILCDPSIYQSGNTFTPQFQPRVARLPTVARLPASHTWQHVVERDQESEEHQSSLHAWLTATALGLLIALTGNVQAAFANAAGTWGYTEKGLDWGAEFPKCDGKAQTPIDIKDRDVEEERGESIIKQLIYKPVDAELENMAGKTVQVNGAFGSFKLPDGNYEVKQFHFHFPSEHTIEGKNPAGELHIVHQKRGSSGVNDVACIGIMLTLSDASDGPEGDWMRQLGFGRALPAAGGAKVSIPKLDLMSFESQLGGGFYHYKGSLTTPPCAETVHWYVLKRSAPVTKAMVDTFKSRFPANNRGIMPLNGRMLFASTVSLPGEF